MRLTLITKSLLPLLLLLLSTTIKAQYCNVGSSPTCGGLENYSNFGLNSNNNAATIAYDNWVAGYHASTIRNTDGTFSIWGEFMNATGTGHLLTPQVINSTTYPGLTGTVLKAAVGGYNQAIILTTTGLFTVGRVSAGNVLSSGATGVIATPAFTKLNATSAANITNGTIGTALPDGVNPSNVKMMFASTGILALTTCDGSVWVISSNLAQVRGNGSASSNTKNWYRVKTDQSGNPFLTKIVATRGNGSSLFALDSEGKLWTWGYKVYKGNNTPKLLSISFATQMTGPVLNPGATVKMIGSTIANHAAATSDATYYVLATDGNLYSLGNNTQHQIGNWSDVETLQWVQPTYSLNGQVMNDIKWISPQEHYTEVNGMNIDGSAAINVITNTGLLYNWGYNRRGMLGRVNKDTAVPQNPNSGDNFYDPGIPLNPGTATSNYQITGTTTWNGVETGGHTTMAIRSCESKLIYAGHRVNGSMGDNSDVDQNQFFFTNVNTPELKICGASSVNHEIAGGITNFCQGSSFTINSSPAGGAYTVISGNASGANPFTVTGPGDIVITYKSSCGSPDTFTLFQKDFGNLSSPYPLASATIKSNNSAWLGSNTPDSDCSIKTTDGADGVNIVNAVCGSGSSASPWTVRANQTYNFNVSVNGNGQQKPVYWAMWYDVNGDGDFTDADDIFQSGNNIHNGVVTSSFSVVIPTSVSSLPIGTIAGIRVVATANLTTFSKALNGDVQVINGEIEDYFVNYALTTTCEQICVNLPTIGVPDSYTKMGISAIEGFANEWPNNVPNGFIAIESKNKGFVITRVAKAANIIEPVDGMLIYDQESACVKLYYENDWHCLKKLCVNAPSPTVP